MDEGFQSRVSRPAKPYSSRASGPEVRTRDLSRTFDITISGLHVRLTECNPRCSHRQAVERSSPRKERKSRSTSPTVLRDRSRPLRIPTYYPGNIALHFARPPSLIHSLISTSETHVVREALSRAAGPLVQNVVSDLRLVPRFQRYPNDMLSSNKRKRSTPDNSLADFPSTVVLLAIREVQKGYKHIKLKTKIQH